MEINNKIKTLPKVLQDYIGEYNVHHRSMMMEVCFQLATVYINKNICNYCLNEYEECTCNDEYDYDTNSEDGYDSDGISSRIWGQFSRYGYS